MKHPAYDPENPEFFFREPGEIVTLNAHGARNTCGGFHAGERVRFMRYDDALGTPVVQELEPSVPDSIWYVSHHGIEGGA